RLCTSVVYEPKARAGSICKCLAPVARWVVTQNKLLFQLVTKDFGVIVPEIAGDGLEMVSVESLKTSLGIRPDQVPSFLALTESGKTSLFTKRQAIRLLEVHDNLVTLLQNIACVSSSQMRRQLSANEKVLLGELCGMRLE